MAYSEKLANRIRKALIDLPDVKEKKMFGGLAFMVDGKMCITTSADKIMCRIDPAKQEALIKIKGCNRVLMGGREYKGYVQVDEDSIKSNKDFDYWIALSLDYNKKAKSFKK